MALQSIDVTDPWEDFQKEVLTELERSRRVLSEVTLMVEQSETELTKLTQRNALITGQLQQVQSNFDSMPRSDIRTAYTNAMDAQQRLLVMRGQIEKMKSDQTHLQALVTYLEKAQSFMGEGKSVVKAPRNSSGSNILEMTISAQEAERQRLSRQMHDGPAQALSNFIVQTEIATRLFDMDPSKAKEELNNLKSAAMSTFQKVRTFIFELRPMMLDDLGLFPTLRRYVDAFKEQTGMDVHLAIKGKERRLEPFLEVMLFRATQELMGNAARHNSDSAAKVQINVQIGVEDNLVKVFVGDNGKGFDLDAVAESGGLGLKIIRERVEMLGGYMEIDSAIGQGSKISFQVPCLEANVTGAEKKNS
jgi:Signal transduction histidine kinase